MISTIIGWFFIIASAVWVFGCILASGMAEYRTTWRDVSPWVFASVPTVLLGVAIVWR